MPKGETIYCPCGKPYIAHVGKSYIAWGPLWAAALNIGPTLGRVLQMTKWGLGAEPPGKKPYGKNKAGVHQIKGSSYIWLRVH